MPSFRAILPVLLLLSVSASGQRVLLGLKGGGNFSNAVGADAVNSNLRLGAHGGMLTRLELPALGPVRGLAVQAEALYAVRGDNGTDYGFTIGRRLNYLDVPLLLRYQGRDGLFAEAGAQYGLLLNSVLNLPPPTVPRQDELVLTNRQLSFVVGVGFQDSSGVSVGWRYVGGISKVFEPSDNPVVGQRQLRNSSLELYLNYLFEPRQVVRGAVGAARLVSKTPNAIYQAGRFLFYTGPAKVIKAIRSPKKKEQETPPAP